MCVRCVWVRPSLTVVYAKTVMYLRANNGSGENPRGPIGPKVPLQPRPKDQKVRAGRPETHPKHTQRESVCVSDSA
jgi:hypothetical protein